MITKITLYLRNIATITYEVGINNVVGIDISGQGESIIFANINFSTGQSLQYYGVEFLAE